MSDNIFRPQFENHILIGQVEQADPEELADALALVVSQPLLTDVYNRK